MVETTFCQNSEWFRYVTENMVCHMNHPQNGNFKKDRPTGYVIGYDLLSDLNSYCYRS